MKLTSRAYDGLAKILAALRSHDAQVVERLAAVQVQNRSPKGRPGLEGDGVNAGGCAPGTANCDSWSHAWAYTPAAENTMA
ncbi:hypothetical protein ACFC08_39080 [Streptomyces sp. NPDC056112]|uniref:hypothetical protein n=1 Tax=Streptomyces sp. NPDC056112 TaxID=3345715 RepID=UPI0035DE891C